MATVKSSRPQSSKTQPRAAKPQRMTPKGLSKVRARRSPAQLLADLKTRRDRIADKMGGRLSQLDVRIARMTQRYDTHLRLAELTTGVSLEDLQQQLDDTRRHQKLLRLALKTKL
jgi:hypothetical protein